MIPALSTREPNWRERVGFTVLSGLLMTIAQAPYGWWWCALPAMFLLCRVAIDTSSRQAFWYGMLHGMTAYGFSLFWFTYLFGPAAFPLYAILAIFVAIFCLLLNRLAQRVSSPWVLTVLGAALWTGIEFFRGELFTLRFPWITPGTAWGPNWLLPLIGVYGVSFVVLVAVLAMLFRRTMRAGLGLAAVLVLLALCRPPPVPPPADAIEVALVQSEDCIPETYLALTREHAPPTVRLILWPEYAVPYDIRRYPRDLERLQDLCAEYDATLIFGTKTDIPGGGGKWWNTALVMDAGGIRGEHYKNRPVHLFDDGSPGTEAKPIATDLGLIGTPICFDCDFAGVVRRLVANGAELIASPVFDAEAWSWVQHVQHAQLFRLRAAENGRWLVTAATSGVTQIIDPHGNVAAHLPLMADDVLLGRVGRRSRRTVYNRVGWLFPWVALITALAAALRLLFRPRQEPPAEV